MIRSLKVCAFASGLLFASSALAQYKTGLPPAADGNWYYCPTSATYYPWAQACSSNWQAWRIPAGADLPPKPRPAAWQSQMGPAGQQLWGAQMSELEATYRIRQQQERLQQLAAIHKKEIDAANAVKHAKDAKAGYRRVTLFDIDLDKRAISDKAKLIVSGMYQISGSEEWLVTIPDNFNYPSLPLITEDAPRDTRSILQRCKLSTICAITLVGHLGDCAHAFLGTPYKVDRCLYVTGTRSS